MALPNLMTIVEELKTPALILAGIAGGNLAGGLIDRFVPVDPAAEGFQAKALIKPAALLTAGVATAMLIKNPNVKLVATGVAISGVASGVKAILKKDILSGLGEITENVQTLRREPLALAIEAYKPELPNVTEYAALPSSPEVDGFGSDEDVQEAEIL